MNDQELSVPVVVRPVNHRSGSRRARARWRAIAFVPLAVGAAVVGQLPPALGGIGFVLLFVGYPARIWLARRRSTITLGTEGLIVQRLGAPVCVAGAGEAVWIYRHSLLGLPGGAAQVWVGPTGSVVLLETEWGVDQLGELARQLGAVDRETQHPKVRVSDLIRLYPEAYPKWLRFSGVRWLADVEAQIWIAAVLALLSRLVLN